MLSKLAVSFVAVICFFLAAAAAALSSAASYDPNLAWRALWYAKVSSCTNAAAVASWSCGQSCQYFPNFQLEGVFTNSTYDDLAFVGYDPEKNWIVLSLQGSEDIAEWITDADFKQAAAQTLFASAPSDAKIHDGFLHEWRSYSSQVLNAIDSVLAKNPNPAMILVTGHSLGGAVALLGGLKIIERFNTTIPVSIYTYGEPRVGNPQFAAWAQEFGFAANLPHTQHRVTHKSDIVVGLPNMDEFGTAWLHVPQEVWYDNDANVSYVLCTGNAEQGKEDPHCADSTIQISIHDHLYYLGICTGCECNSEQEAKNRFREAKLRKHPKWQKMIKSILDSKK